LRRPYERVRIGRRVEVNPTSADEYRLVRERSPPFLAERQDRVPFARAERRKETRIVAGDPDTKAARGRRDEGVRRIEDEHLVHGGRDHSLPG
jgi:hypothetical protein